MYNTTEMLNAAILGDTRKFYARITGENGDVSEEIKNIKQYTDIGSNGTITIGGAISSYATISLWEADLQIEGKEITVEIGIELETGDTAWIPLGKFIADTPKKSSDGLIEFTAYDRIQTKLSGAFFSELNYPTDAINVLNEISAKTGVPIDTSNLTGGITISQRKIVSSNEIDSSGNVVENITYENPFNGYTYREALGYLAMLYCKYAVSGRDGTIKFVWYEETGQSITADYYYDGLQTAELAFTIGTITCNTGEEELKSGAGTNNIQLENPVMTQERLDYIYSQVQKLQFIPASFSFYGNHLLDAGDIVSLVKTDGTIYKVPIMNIYHEFDGGLKTTVQSYGGAEQENANKGALLSRLERQYTELLLVKELVGNKASFDYVYALSGDFKTLNADYGGFKELVADDFEAVNAEIENVKANNITTDNLNAELANIGVLTVTEADLKYATINELNAVSGDFESLKAKAVTTDNLSASVASLGYATIDETDIRYAKITTLETEYLKLENLSAETAKLGYATVEELEVTNGNFDSLNADYTSFKSTTTQSLTAQQADITKLSGDYANFKSGEFAVLKADHAALETLVNGNLTSENIHSLTLNAQNTTIANGMITNAMIESLAFGKITGVDINTTNLTIHSEDGKSKWSDNTIQISDATRVRVQIGKDASGDYTLALWDSSGKLIWDALGATEHTIQRKIIRDAVVADDAAIAGSKLDIDSVVQEVNGAQTKLNSTTIMVDETKQTLDVYLNTLETTVGDNLDAAKLYADGQLSTAQQYALTAAENALASAKSYTDGLEIGGRNYILCSKLDTDTYWSFSSDVVCSFGNGYLELKASENYTGTSRLFFSQTQQTTLFPSADFVKNETFTLSADVKAISGVSIKKGQSIIYRVGIEFSGSDYREVTIEIPEDLSSDTWTRLHATYTFGEYDYSSAEISIAIHANSGFCVKNIKLEKGNRATDWTPAPEDTEEKITNLTEITTAHTTNISVMQGQISSLIAEDTTIKGDYDALVSRYNATVADVSSMQTKIAEHTTLIDAQTQDILAVQNKASTLESSLDGFKTTVSETYTTKAEFEGLEVGGRNLVRFNPKNWSVYSISSVVINGYKASLVASNGSCGIGIPGTLFETGKTYVLSYKFKKTGGTLLGIGGHSAWFNTIKFIVDGNVSSNPYGTLYQLEDDESEHEVIVILTRITNSASDNDSLYIQANRDNTSVKVDFDLWDVMLEEGNTPTDWTPAPEDAEEKITSLETWKTEASQKITKDGIIATVGNYYAYQSDLASAESRIATTETTIAQHTNQIALTVKESDVTGNYLVGKINLSSTTAQIAAKNIDLSGYVTVSSLSTAGATTIDGANIKTGTIDAERIDVDALMAMELTATNLHVTGNSVFDGKLNGATGTFAGSLSAASGTFTGVLSGATGTFSGSLNAASGTFAGALSGATGDFSGKITATSGKIGNWFINSSRIMSSETLYFGAKEVGMLLVNESDKPFIWMQDANGSSKFSVARDGVVTATNANITGSITANSLAAKCAIYLQNPSNTSAGSSAISYSGEKLILNGDYGGNQIGNGTINYGPLWVYGSGIELHYSTPYIDFHFGNSTADYTSRIIESESGQLNAYAKWYCYDWGGSTLRRPVSSANTDGTRTAYIASKVNSSGTYFLTVNGQYGTTGSDYNSHNINCTTSDVRLKTNILDTDITALPVINQMQVRQFDWIDNGIHQKIGFIADELEVIDPALAIGGGWDEDGNMDVKSVNDFYLLGYLTKGIQELCTVQADHADELITHQSQINYLLDENAALKKRIEQLEQQIA